MPIIQEKDIKELRDVVEATRIKGEFHNFCKEYKFNFFGDTEEFNTRFNEGNMWEFLFFDRTEFLYKDIELNIVNGGNYIFFFFGPGRNIAKTEGGFSLLFKHQRIYYIIKNKQTKIYYGFDDGDFMIDIIPNMNDGDIAMRDESPPTSGEGSKTMEKNLKTICNTTRQKQVSFIFINPQPIKIPGVDYYLEAAGRDLKTRKNRYILYNRNMIMLGVIFLKLHDNEEFRKEYVRRKGIFINTEMALSGGNYIPIDIEKLTKDSIKLYEYCHERGARTKIDIITYQTNYNSQFMKPEEIKNQILGTDAYLKKLYHNIFLALNGKPSLLDVYLRQKDIDEKKNNDEIAEEESQERYIPTEEEIKEVQGKHKGSGFIPFLKKWYDKKLPESVRISEQTDIEKEIIIEILESWAYGLGIRKITHNYEEQNDSRLSQGIVNDVTILFKDGKRNYSTIKDEWRLYRCYEDWCAYKYNLKVVSGHAKEDFILLLDNNLSIKGECKIWDDQKSNIRKKKEKIYHTYKEYNERKALDPNFPFDSFPALWRNVKWGDRDFFYDVSLSGDLYFNHENDSTRIINNVSEIKEFYEKKLSKAIVSSK